MKISWVILVVLAVISGERAARHNDFYWLGVFVGYGACIVSFYLGRLYEKKGD